MRIQAFVVMVAVALALAGAARSTDNLQYLDPDFVAVERANTIWIGAKDEPIELVGFKAPETDYASCSRERIVGLRATARVIELIETGPASLQIVPCGCPTGSEGSYECRSDRKCGVLAVEGRDVGKTLIAEGLAVSFVCTPSECPPIPKPWCSG